MYTIGTAGHVDHGKSALIQAITGIDPDRLREEKERGLTVDLGFAWLTLPSGREVSIVDVPGHERFIKNMLAGASGFDLALLVVAADEGPRPQTLEHLAILDVLDVPSLLVVMTKCDLVESGYADLVELEIEQLLAGTRFASASLVRVSIADGASLGELVRAIDRSLDDTAAKLDLGRPRLAVDRVFSVRGFGTVVTGTLIEGTLEAGQDVEFQPGSVRGRIRGLQRHGHSVTQLGPGTRTAVNVSGINPRDVGRGMVLAAPGHLAPVRSLDVRLRALSTMGAPLRSGGVTFLTGTAESEARLRLLDRDELAPEEEGWAEVILDSPVALLPSDRCIIRRPGETVAGGVVASVNPPPRRRRTRALIDSLERLVSPAPATRVREFLRRGPLQPAALERALGLDTSKVAEARASLASAGEIIELGGICYERDWLDAKASQLEELVRHELGQARLRAALPREQVRTGLRVRPEFFEAILKHAVAEGRIEELGNTSLTLPGFRPELTARERTEVATFLTELAVTGYGSTATRLSDAALVRFMVEQQLIEDAGGGVVFERNAFHSMTQAVVDHLGAHGSLSLRDAKDLLGLSRKYAQAYLERLDALHVTRRVGDERVLANSPDGDAAV